MKHNPKQIINFAPRRCLRPAPDPSSTRGNGPEGGANFFFEESLMEHIGDIIPKVLAGIEPQIMLYADGACMPNPGETAIGVVLKYGSHVKEISQATGYGTNNTAELNAIRIGLEALKKKEIPVTIISDSQYALNTLSGRWAAKTNTQLIESIRDLCGGFKVLTLKWVRGHSGDKHQERAHQLAEMALRKATGDTNNA